METIHVLLLKPSENDHWLNRATAALGGWVHNNDGFCHVELCVPNERGSYVSSSIYQGETVSLNERKRFANPGYQVHSMVVTRKQLQDIHKFMQRAHREKVGFDGTGMYLAALPLQTHCMASPQSTFCSRYVVEALQAADIEAVRGLNAHIVTPSKLYSVLTAHGDNTVAGTVQYKEQRMMSGAVGATKTYVAKPNQVPHTPHSYMRLTSL